MKIKFGKKEIKGLLEKYYREKEDFDGIITTRCYLGSVGYGMTEREDALVEVKLIGQLNVLGTSVLMTRNLTRDDVKDTFNVILNEAGYEMSDISYDVGIRSTCCGYGLDEHTVNRPYFNGIVATVKTKTLVR